MTIAPGTSEPGRTTVTPACDSSWPAVAGPPAWRTGAVSETGCAAACSGAGGLILISATAIGSPPSGSRFTRA